MAEQITGAKLDVGPNVPLLDVDTAIVHLLEDLHRAGRTNEAHAVRHLVAVAREMAQMPEGWGVVLDGTLGAYDVKAINWTTRLIEVESRGDDGGSGSGAS
jgi:hypothetical protein